MFLKPCPFCGGGAKVEYSICTWQGQRTPSYCVRCTACESRTHRFRFDKNDPKSREEAEGKAVETWNQRKEKQTITYKIIR